MTNRVLRALLAGTALAIAIEAPSVAQNSKFDRLDTNHDGVISREEFDQAHPPRVERPADPRIVTGSDTTTPQEGLTTASPTSATGEPAQAQDFMTTGSRIPRGDLSFSSPITAVTSEEVRLQGTSRTEDLINSLPQAFAAQGAAINKGALGGTSSAAGTATVNLRGLGDSRTLVLVNGRRLHPGDIFSPAPDINFVPHQLIKRVDVLTGGASSVYGSDAVAGVVNFVLDTGFTGFRIDAQASTFMHDNDADDSILGALDAAGLDPPHGQEYDGRALDIAATFGTDFADGRGHVQAYGTYRDQRGVRTRDRDYSFCNLAAAAAGGFDCIGSNVSEAGTFFTNVGTFQVVGNQFASGASVFNEGPFSYLQRPDERYTLGGFAEYEISPALRPYGEVMFMDDKTVAQTSPSGDFFNTTTINCDNPLLSTQQFNTICVPNNTFVDANGITRAIAELGRRNVEGGPRRDDIDHSSFRVAGGLRGDPVKGISYDAYYQFGRTRRNSTHENDVSVSRLTRALDVIANPAVGGLPGVPAGTPVCRSAVQGIDLNCVPYNVFLTDGVTPEALDYLRSSGSQRGVVDESIAHADVTVRGEEFGVKLPWAEHGIGLNFGAEYRKQKVNFRADEQFGTGDLTGEAGPIHSFSGHYDVRDLFAETLIPIVEHGFIDLLQLSGGYRNSHYKVEGNSFNADAYSIGGEFAPIPDVRARASYNRAIRAPNLFELFVPTSLGLAAGIDPCAAGSGPNGPAGTALTTAQCLNTFATQIANGTFTVGSATAAINAGIDPNPASQYNVQLGGNALLQPEKADTFTAGLVLQPRFIPGLAITVDYFDIKVKNRVTTFPFTGLLANCGVTGDPAFCNRVNRDAAGSLWLQDGFIDAGTFTNAGGLRTKGIDFSGAYSRPLAGGTINVSMVGTWLKDQIIDSGFVDSGFETAAGQNGRYDCAKFYGVVCGTPNPEWRHKLRVGFALPNGLGISGQWRYFSSVRNDGLLDDCDVNPTGTCTNVVAPENQEIGAQSYFDLALTATVMNKFDFRLGARNIFDKQPPIVGGEVSPAPFGNGNSYPQVYDALGRYLFVGISANFTPPPPPPAPPPPQIAPPPPLPPPATQTCADGSVILATNACPVPPPPPPPPPEPERG